ncbi:MAG: hypothetical protein E5X77_21775 [Mesorhizobium sp.]|nr:MAG: hypothetical protein E5X77_21775 [Mesorhizobium sp.]
MDIVSPFRERVSSLAGLSPGCQFFCHSPECLDHPLRTSADIWKVAFSPPPGRLGRKSLADPVGEGAGLGGLAFG